MSCKVINIKVNSSNLGYLDIVDQNGNYVFTNVNVEDLKNGMNFTVGINVNSLHITNFRQSGLTSSCYYGNEGAYTKLLLHFNTQERRPDNISTKWFDSSIFNIGDGIAPDIWQDITYANDAALPDGKFSKGCFISYTYPIGTQHILTMPDQYRTFDFRKSFTIDFWFKIDKTPVVGATANAPIIQYVKGATTSNMLFYGNLGGSQRFAINGYPTSYIDAASLPDNTWSHIALVGNSLDNTTKFFIDGVSQGISGTSSFTTLFSDYFPDDYPLTSSLSSGDQISLHDWEYSIDELRVSTGIARWTSDFTPPTDPYTAD